MAATLRQEDRSGLRIGSFARLIAATSKRLSVGRRLWRSQDLHPLLKQLLDRFDSQLLALVAEPPRPPLAPAA